MGGKVTKELERGARIMLSALFGGKPEEPAPVHTDGHQAYLQSLADDLKRGQERLAQQEEERRRGQLELDRLRTELRDEQGSIQEQQQRMQEKEKEIAREKAELKRKQEMEAALGEKRYEMRTKDDLERIRREAHDKVGFDSFEFNVGITGQTGTGKSTLVNALCGLDEDDSGAAKTGETETSMEMKKYNHPDAQILAIWDLPGAGTATHPIKTYFFDKYLFMFDALVILYEDRFKEDDADLIRQAIAYRVPFAVVRTKAGQAFQSRKRNPEHRSKTNEVIVQELIDLFCKNTVDELEKFKTHIDQHSIFVINGWALTDENEPRFQEAELIKYVCHAARSHRP